MWEGSYTPNQLRMALRHDHVGNLQVSGTLRTERRTEPLLPRGRIPL